MNKEQNYHVTAVFKPTGERVTIHDNLTLSEAKSFIGENCRQKCWTENYKNFRKKKEPKPKQAPDFSPSKA